MHENRKIIFDWSTVNYRGLVAFLMSSVQNNSVLLRWYKIKGIYKFDTNA